MAQLVLNRGNKYRKNVVQKLFPKVELGPYFLMISLIVFVALIIIITLTFSARQVTKGYVLNSLEAVHQDLSRENETQDMMISEVRSLTYIEQTPKFKSMIKPDKIVYVSGDTALAKR